MADPHAVTEILAAYRRGEPGAFDKLVEILYEDLKRLARRRVARSDRRATLDTTALVHEAYLKLGASPGSGWNDREHFFAVAARAMRQIVVDHARAQRRAKRGGGNAPVDIENVQVGVDQEIEKILGIDSALGRLQETDPRLVRVVECRYFAGLSEEETSAALALPLRTVQRSWQQAKSWLKSELGPRRVVEGAGGAR